MALPKKGSRKIVVNDIAYRYVISGNDCTIDIIIELEESNKQRLIVSFDYKISGRVHPQRQITPLTVKETIESALKKGWAPNEKGKEMRIHFSETENEL